MAKIEYMDIHNAFTRWVVEGNLRHPSTQSMDEEAYTEFDVFILRSLGFKTNGRLDRSSSDKNCVHSVACTLTENIENGKLNLDWVVGPNGYALWRAKQIHLQES